MTKLENGEGRKTKKVKQPIRAILSALTVVRWDTTSQNVPTISQKRLQ